MIPVPVIDDVVDRALAEDLGAGDLTSEACVDATVRARGHAVARAPLVVCGGDVFRRVFLRLDPGCWVVADVPDGARVDAGARLWTVEGPARSVLGGERTALNFAQRMCGIATLARAFVDALPPGCRTRVTDTRKTTPGLRALERYAVRTGGAHNHRADLGAAVLIKDNHVVAAGGIARAIERARARAPHPCRVEVEVESLEQLDLALGAGADVVLLDNFPVDRLREAVRRVAGRAIVEASGGVRLDRVAEIAATGVDVVSVGALTHSAPAADIALDLEVVP